MDHSSTPLISSAHRVGFVLTRIVTPAWVLTGATFKLVERTPKNLPSEIWRRAVDAGIDLHVLLTVLIVVEFALAGVMLFVPRLARLAAIALLGVFCGVLINEMRVGASSCGCLGKVPMKPWHMLAIDGTLLVGVVALGRHAAGWPGRRMSSALGAVALPAIAAVACTLWVLPERAGGRSRDDAQGNLALPQDATQPAQPAQSATTKPDQSLENAGQGTASSMTLPDLPSGDANPLRNPSPRQLPSTWYPKDLGSWIGKPWREIELFQMMPVWPKGLDDAKRYVVFYSRTCEHCEAMFLDDLIIPLDAPITAIEIPADRNVLTAPGAWEMPKLAHIDFGALPVGTTLWMMTPPMALRLENGIVTCATEQDHKECLGLP